MVFTSKVLQTAVAFLFVSCVCQDMISAQSASDNTQLLGVDNFIIINRRQYAAVIANMDNTLTNFQKNYDSQVTTIDNQAVLLEKRMQEVSASWNPLDVLSATSRACVQKYRGNIVNVETIKSTIATCSAAATNSYPTFVAAPQVTRNNLNTYYAVNFETLLTSCNKSFPADKLPSNYTACVQTTILTANSVTVSNQKIFDTQMEASECLAKSRIKLSIDCSYSAQFTTIASIGEYTRLINNCVAGLETCAPCPAPAPSSAVPACGTNVKIAPADATVDVEKINNPFRGLAANATCVVLNKSA